MKVVPGQKVYVKRIGNEARYKGEYYTEETVEDVKRKWFTISKFWRESFSIENGYNDGRGYSSTLIVYESAQDIEDEKEIETKCKKIASAFDFGHNVEGLSIDKIRKIYNTIFDIGAQS
jgi:hypothetical protein